ncbi:MAG: hypothetical protein AUK48_04290 [Oscillatoriales cyanobacterium CG2_30_44_21]|nr:MAG: hypothetical protein AUK48_04290 [Oscillatoriales cyanobacterium CG2_30_44_21]
MEALTILTEVRTIHPEISLGKIFLDWMPQPGNYIDVEGKTYTILERRHRYQLRGGRYNLASMLVYVQRSPEKLERSFINDRWIIGDAACRFNAVSEILRCAVNPNGPCQGCNFWEASPERNHAKMT